MSAITLCYSLKYIALLAGSENIPRRSTIPTVFRSHLEGVEREFLLFDVSSTGIISDSVLFTSVSSSKPRSRSLLLSIELEEAMLLKPSTDDKPPIEISEDSSRIPPVLFGFPANKALKKLSSLDRNDISDMFPMCLFASLSAIDLVSFGIDVSLLGLSMKVLCCRFFAC